MTWHDLHRLRCVLPQNNICETLLCAPEEHFAACVDVFGKEYSKIEGVVTTHMYSVDSLSADLL